VVVGNRKLGRYSATSGAEEATTSLPSNSQRVLVAFGFVWVSGTGNDELYRIDPATNQIAATIGLRSRPRALAAGEGAIWVCNEGDGTVQRIDGKTDEQIATVGTGTVGLADMTVGGGFIRVGTASRDLIQIDPRANSVRGKFKPASGDICRLKRCYENVEFCTVAIGKRLKANLRTKTLHIAAFVSTSLSGLAIGASIGC
jgi:virginiamycin B lyase